MQFGNGGSQFGFVPKDLRSAALPHMGNPPDTSFLTSLKNYVSGGKNPSIPQRLGQATFLSLAARMAMGATGGWPMTLLQMGLPYLMSGVSSVHDRFSKKGNPYQ